MDELIFHKVLGHAPIIERDSSFNACFHHTFKWVDMAAEKLQSFGQFKHDIGGLPNMNGNPFQKTGCKDSYNDVTYDE